MPDTLTPITREETYLAAIAGEDVSTPDPICRKEEFLAAIDGHVDAVEGDVADLAAIVPTPVALDEGKVLTAGSTAGTATWQNVPKELPASLGTAGQVLTVNAGATGVEWKTPSGGGGGNPVVIYTDDSYTLPQGETLETLKGKPVDFYYQLEGFDPEYKFTAPVVYEYSLGAYHHTATSTDFDVINISASSTTLGLRMTLLVFGSSNALTTYYYEANNADYITLTT